VLLTDFHFRLFTLVFEGDKVFVRHSIAFFTRRVAVVCTHGGFADVSVVYGWPCGWVLRIGEVEMFSGKVQDEARQFIKWISSSEANVMRIGIGIAVPTVFGKAEVLQNECRNVQKYWQGSP